MELADTYAASAATTMLAQAQQLLDQSLTRSAQLMTSMLLSELQRNNGPSGSSVYAEAQFLFARCLARNEEHRRAMASGVEQTAPFDAPTDLEAIAERSRSLEINSMLAKIYEAQGSQSAAMACYMAILQVQPHAVEASLALLRFGVNIEEVHRMAQLSTSQSHEESRPTNARSAGQLDWAADYLKAEAYTLACDYDNALAKYQQLSRRFPKNSHLLLKVAACQLNRGDTINAYHNFVAVRQLDAKVVEHMDRFAGLVHGQKNAILLNRVAEELINVNERRPEGWVAMAIYCQNRAEFERGLMLADRALALDGSHVEAHCIKGALLQAMDRKTEALLAYRIAYQHQRNPYVYQGLLDAYLSLNNLQPAITYADEAVSRMPRNALVLALAGSVYRHIPGRLDDAKEIIQEALALDPDCHRAIKTQEKIFLMEEKYDEAIDAALKQLPAHNTDSMHCNIAKLYILKNDCHSALDHYSMALSLDPSSVEASEGKEQLEAMLRDTTGGQALGVLGDEDTIEEHEEIYEVHPGSDENDYDESYFDRGEEDGDNYSDHEVADNHPIRGDLRARGYAGGVDEYYPDTYLNELDHPLDSYDLQRLIRREDGMPGEQAADDDVIHIDVDADQDDQLVADNTMRQLRRRRA
ncbi:hypothetical protein THASP1DRAFT_32429 [Thamnocephalis sphaerospora]|uniref:Uncharacterized protein n=1 Tax=Thamnocephalis sphaerospora TaxID=78915 RepID=A0A4P9XJ23_9FUNG|nr:hypothetical protein THASP1DRAFT_32429 [Thamnocephalis sphaerospora]|eukprot:RKP05735.1 hypothetical protein THASP1DRAFT_32429 [Thamnocephalis sphaerospora]